MDIINIIEKYPSERDCLEHLKELREKCKIICANCACKEFKWIADSNEMECKHCRSRLRINNETVLENSILPKKYWFIAIYILSSSIRPISVTELQKRLAFPNDEPVIEMVNHLKLLLKNMNGECTFETLLLACVQRQTEIQYTNTQECQGKLIQC